MDYLIALLLGFVEGLTEYIPVSSTGHLLLLSHFLNFHTTGQTFEVLIQLGAVLALLRLYFNRLWNVVITLPSNPQSSIASLSACTLPDTSIATSSPAGSRSPSRAQVPRIRSGSEAGSSEHARRTRPQVAGATFDTRVRPSPKPSAKPRSEQRVVECAHARERAHAGGKLKPRSAKPLRPRVRRPVVQDCRRAVRCRRSGARYHRRAARAHPL